MTRPQVSGSVARLADLVRSSKNASDQYHSETEMLASQIADLRSHIVQGAAEGWSFAGLFSGWQSVLSWTIGVLIMLLVAYIIFAVCRRSVCAPASLAMAHMPLKGFAASVGAASNYTMFVNITPGIAAQATAVTPLQNITEALQASPYVIHLTSAVFHWDLLIAVFVFGLTIYWTRTFIMAEHRSMLARMGLFAKNSEVVHHMGESSLVIFFLVRSASLFGGSHRAFEIPIELCTVPGRALSWTCTPSHGYQELVRGVTIVRRGSRTLVVKLDLNPLKITSSEFPGLDGSANLPKRVSVPINHLHHVIGHHARWDWTSLHVVSVTGMAISFPGTFRYIYHYSKPGPERRSMYMGYPDE